MLELLAKRISKSEPGFSPKHVRWAITFDSKAGYIGIVELGQPEQKKNLGREFQKCPEMDRGLLQAGGKSHFLVEAASVVARYKGTEDPKTRQKHRFFVSMLEEAGKTIPQFATIARFMKQEDILHKIQQDMERKKVKHTDKVTFQIDGEFPVEKDYWHDWWRSFRQSLLSKTAARSPLFRCFVTGDLVVPAPTHPRIKGLAAVGGRPGGDTLIGFDKEAFQSYGLKQSFNAAVSEEAAWAYSEALNGLIRNAATRLGGTIIAHWFKEKVEQENDPLYFITEAPEIQELNAQQRARELLQSLEMGKRPELIHNRYYILAMSGADGRVMVRDWLEGDFHELVKNVKQWFDDLEMTSFLSPGISANSPRLEDVVTCMLTPRREQKSYQDWVQPVGAARLELLHAAIQNLPIPYGVLSRVVPVHRSFILSEEWQRALNGERNNSIRKACSLLQTRMALMKAYHLRKHRKEGNKLAEMLTPKLNKDFPSAAYQCGRLLAVLGQLQRAALGDVGAGVVQRYYTAASSTPALVLGRLTSNSQHHLGKLESSSPGLAHWYESRISEIWSRVTEPLPKTLTLEEQSLFALGYYQELADLRAAKIDTKEKEV